LRTQNVDYTLIHFHRYRCVSIDQIFSTSSRSPISMSSRSPIRRRDGSSNAVARWASLSFAIMINRRWFLCAHKRPKLPNRI
jgi:hypothetical protein